jgi:hypothetical protein
VSLTRGIGNDEVNIKGGGARFDGSLTIDLGAGSDVLLLAGASESSHVTLNGQTSILGNGGSDGILFNAVSINGTFFADSGDGADELIALNLSSTVTLAMDFGQGNDIASFGSVDLFGVELDGGTGFDELKRTSNTDLGTELIEDFELDHSS